MNYFDINLYPQGLKNKKRNAVIHQMDIAHRLLLLVAVIMTVVYIVTLVRGFIVKDKLNRQFDELKQRAFNQRITDQEKDKILFLLNKEKHEVIVGRFLRLLMKYKISGMTIKNTKCKRLTEDLMFTVELRYKGISRYKVDDIEKMIDNMMNDHEYKLKIHNMTIQEMSISQGGVMNVMINGKVKIFE